MNLKQIAKQSGRTIKSLLVLHGNNDPFNVSQTWKVQAAEWFTGLWREFGRPGLHLRGFHYVLVIQPNPVTLPRVLTYKGVATDIYINTKGCWGFMQDAAKFARYLGRVPFGEISDARTRYDIFRDPQFTPGDEFDVGWTGSEIEYIMPECDDMTKRSAWRKPLEERDNKIYLVELWIEKSTQNDILIPICQRYGANLVFATGQMTVTSCYELIKRIGRAGRPTRIFYINDMDDSGRSMPVAVARKLEWFCRHEYPGLDIKLMPLVLTPEQVDEYDLPKAPDSGYVELDALEGLHPGALNEIVESAIKPYCHASIEGWIGSQFSKLLSEARRTDGEIGSILETDIHSFKEDFESMRADWQNEVDEMRERLDDLNSRLRNGQEYKSISPTSYLENIDQAIQDALIDEDDFLFESQRDFFEQLEWYRNYQNKDDSL